MELLVPVKSFQIVPYNLFIIAFWAYFRVEHNLIADQNLEESGVKTSSIRVSWLFSESRPNSSFVSATIMSTIESMLCSKIDRFLRLTSLI